MKKKWYCLTAVKIILLIIALAGAALTGSGFYRFFMNQQLAEDIFEGKDYKNYLTSDTFAETLKNDADTITGYITSVHEIVNGSSVDLNRVVDAYDIFTSEDYSAKTQGKDHVLTFTIHDLNRITVSYSFDFCESADNGISADNVFVFLDSEGTYHYMTEDVFYGKLCSEDLYCRFYSDEAESASDIPDNAISLIKGGEYPEVFDQDDKLLYTECSYFGYVHNVQMIKTTDGRTLLEIAEEEKEWNGNLGMLCDTINVASCAVNNAISTYDDIQEGSLNLPENNGNLIWLYADKSEGTLFSNRSSFTDYKDYKDYLKQMTGEDSLYIIVGGSSSGTDTNISSIDTGLWESAYYSDDRIFAFSIDPAFPADDSLRTEFLNYSKTSSTLLYELILGMIGALLMLVTLLWLTVTSGRSAADETLHLNRFDHWKTEIAAFIILMLWTLGFFPAFYWLADTGNLDARATAMLFTFSWLMFLWGWTSLVKRIKAHTLWSESLLKLILLLLLKGCRYVLRFLRTVFDHLSILWKLIILYAAFILIHWIDIFTSMSHGAALILVAAAEIAVLIFLINRALGYDSIRKGLTEIRNGHMDYKIPDDHLIMDQKGFAEDINSIGEGLNAAVEQSLKSERLKTDLITNVSHDIKTPLTSIINYIDLLKKEDIDDPTVQHYLDVLTEKSARLKNLTEDVVEASKVSSGNITLNMMNLNMSEIIIQTSGEFEEKFAARELKEIMTLPKDPVIIYTDGRRLYRVLENLYNNAAKYAMPGSRVYADLKVTDEQIIFSIKNISEQPLNINADELTERFIRGDVSRSTEGSGLGLSIARSLTELLGGSFNLYLDGDLFKATLIFPATK